MSEQALMQQSWVCVGRRLAASEKTMYQVWREVLASGELGEEKLFKDRAIPGARPGMIYKVHVTVNGDKLSLTMSGPNAPEYEGRWDKPEDVVAWEATSQAHEAQLRCKKLAVDAAKVDELAECLRPIVALMRKTDRAGRRAIKVLVLEMLEDAFLR